MKRAWIILVVVAALGLLFVGGCKSKQAAEETQTQEQPDSSSATAVPEESVPTPQSPAGTSETGQAPPSQSLAGEGQSGKQPASGKESEAATSIEATGSTASPDAEPQVAPVKKLMKIKGLKGQKIEEKQKSEEEDD